MISHCSWCWQRFWRSQARQHPSSTHVKQRAFLQCLTKSLIYFDTLGAADASVRTAPLSNGVSIRHWHDMTISSVSSMDCLRLMQEPFAFTDFGRSAQ
jgi:hypothetical protein